MDGEQVLRLAGAVYGCRDCELRCSACVAKLDGPIESVLRRAVEGGWQVRFDYVFCGACIKESD
jgi:hypothetical protein